MASVEYLGRDEQATAGLFLRLPWVAPTEYDQFLYKMRQEILDMYPGWDYFNLTLRKRLGGSVFDRLGQFTRDYVRVARENERVLDPNDPDSVQFFNAMIRARQPEYYSADDMKDYMTAISTLIEQGKVPDSILNPSGYEASSTVLDDVAYAAGSAVKKAVMPVGIIAILAVGAFAFFGGGFAKADELFRK